MQYMRMRRPARSGAAASIQARRSLKQRMPGSNVCTPSCGRTDHTLSHYMETFFKATLQAHCTTTCPATIIKSFLSSRLEHTACCTVHPGQMPDPCARSAV